MQRAMRVAHSDWKGGLEDMVAEFVQVRVDSATCFCNKPKRASAPFCIKCWLALPPKMREPMTHTAGGKFLEAVEAGRRYLSEHG